MNFEVTYENGPHKITFSEFVEKGTIFHSEIFKTIIMSEEDRFKLYFAFLPLEEAVELSIDAAKERLEKQLTLKVNYEITRISSRQTKRH